MGVCGGKGLGSISERRALYRQNELTDMLRRSKNNFRAPKPILGHSKQDQGLDALRLWMRPCVGPMIAPLFGDFESGIVVIKGKRNYINII